MPSGAKKRKQAKKKKEQQAHHPTNGGSNSPSISDTLSQGNDDPKSQDERDSDGGELGSPASQDHQSQHHSFNEEIEEPEKTVQSSFVAEDNHPIDGVESVVETEREVKLDQNTESTDVNVEHVDFLEASHNGDDKSSSSSSSDDESRAFDEKWKVQSHYSDNAGKIEEVKEDFSSTIEKPLTIANGNSSTETHVMPMSEVAKHHVTGGAQFENAEVLDVVESGFKETEDKLLPKSDVVPEKFEEVSPILYQKAEASSGNEDKLSKSSSSHTSYAQNIKDSEASDSTSVTRASEASKDMKKAKDFEVSENIETQPLVSSAPRIAHRTSFLSCCGLFDVFTGSNRT